MALIGSTQLHEDCLTTCATCGTDKTIYMANAKGMAHGLDTWEVINASSTMETRHEVSPLQCRCHYQGPWSHQILCLRESPVTNTNSNERAGDTCVQHSMHAPYAQNMRYQHARPHDGNSETVPSTYKDAQHQGGMGGMV